MDRIAASTCRGSNSACLPLWPLALVYDVPSSVASSWRPEEAGAEARGCRWVYGGKNALSLLRARRNATRSSRSAVLSSIGSIIGS